jgi:hypothetical protein
VEMERQSDIVDLSFVQVHDREVPLGSHLLCFQSPTVTEKDVVRVKCGLIKARKIFYEFTSGKSSRTYLLE